ncbi:M24 family metallopeptidase [Bradyrhizobium sp. USDA 3364]
MLKIKAAEYETRLKSLKRVMAERSIDAFLITDQANFEYFSGYKSITWISKARPLALLVPSSRSGAIIISSAAEAPAIQLTEEMPSRIEHVAYSGFVLAFIEAIVDQLRACNARRLALDYGFESSGLGSLNLLHKCRSNFAALDLVEGAEDIWQIRVVKSPTEIRQKKVALEVATSSMLECFQELRLGVTEIEFARHLTIRAIEKGASAVPMLSVKFGRGSFPSPLPPTERALAADDFIWTDMGCLVGGSISDVNRIAKAGKVTAEEQARYHEVRNITQKTITAFRAGMTTGEAYSVFEEIARNSSLGLPGPFTAFFSRVGHGSGYSITEPPSISPSSEEVLREGMIIHVEPKYYLEGGVYQTEEVAVIGIEHSELLTIPAPERLPEIKI